MADTAERNFWHLLGKKFDEGKSVCVGLDSETARIPIDISKIHSGINRQLGFNEAIVRATYDIVCAYKINTAFYMGHGAAGIEAMRDTITFINKVAPDVPVILDDKRADIGNTNAGHEGWAFDFLKADAITVNPYFGQEALQPFLDRKEKGIIVLCRTSNEGATEFQGLNVGILPDEFRYLQSVRATPLSESCSLTSLCNHIAYRVSGYWNANDNCMLVVGATAPSELESIRRIVGDMPILIPGIGAQDGDIEKTVLAGKDSHGEGMIINASRSIIFASQGADFAEAARNEAMRLHNLINQYKGKNCER